MLPVPWTTRRGSWYRSLAVPDSTLTQRLLLQTALLVSWAGLSGAGPPKLDWLTFRGVRLEKRLQDQLPPCPEGKEPTQTCFVQYDVTNWKGERLRPFRVRFVDDLNGILAKETEPIGICEKDKPGCAGREGMPTLITMDVPDHLAAFAPTN